MQDNASLFNQTAKYFQWRTISRFFWAFFSRFFRHFYFISFFVANATHIAPNNMTNGTSKLPSLTVSDSLVYGIWLGSTCALVGGILYGGVGALVGGALCIWLPQWHNPTNYQQSLVYSGFEVMFSSCQNGYSGGTDRFISNLYYQRSNGFSHSVPLWKV